MLRCIIILAPAEVWHLIIVFDTELEEEVVEEETGYTYYYDDDMMYDDRIILRFMN